MSSPWTKEQIQTLKKTYPNRPTIAVAESVGRTVESVKRMAARLHLKKSAKYRARKS